MHPLNSYEKLKEECVIRNRTEGTYNNYALEVTQFMNWNKDKKPEDYTLLDARNYIYELRVDLKRSTQHCNGVNSALKLMHVLPKGFVRIRYYGLLSCRCKKDKMTLCRNLLGCEQYISRLRGKNVEEKMMILYNVDICKCKECGEPLRRFRVDGRYMLC